MMKPNIHPEYRTVVFHDTSVMSTLKSARLSKQTVRLSWMRNVSVRNN